MSIVKEFLRQKDSDYSQLVPSAYNLPTEEKVKVLLVQNLRTKY